MTDLEAVAADGLDLSTILRKELRRRLTANGGKDLEDETLRSLSELAGNVTKVLRAEAAMMKEARALEKDAQDKAKRLTHEGKRKVILAVIADLPPEQVAILRSEIGW